MTPEQQQTLDEIITFYRRAAPPGWLRIVCHWECELDDDGDPARAMAHVVIIDRDGSLDLTRTEEPSQMLDGEWDDSHSASTTISRTTEPRWTTSPPASERRFDDQFRRARRRRPAACSRATISRLLTGTAPSASARSYIDAGRS
ncbi:hypothetical protein CLV30_12073 [Haloactinopolyspora alba]|uniref:Uncharacterized protein n=1 Tax=Haloactinopolyspora alba TaxID=648780 RepID=A0A2P8DM68_9ACTN|nr:hypothetical protein CLV30_12073 [Haloactinopolyspora alba]